MHLLYPQICFGCGTDELEKTMPLCHRCIHDLPTTDFFSIDENIVEKIFWGRVPVQHAGALLFFTKNSLVQDLMTQLKYHHNKKVGILLGNLIGEAIAVEERFKQIDLLIPIPILSSKTQSRGYNQSQVIALGIQQKWSRPIETQVLVKKSWSNTQTMKNRKSRMQQVPDLFMVQNVENIKGKNILLVDDVLTTGATLEAAIDCLMKGAPASVSIAVAAYTL